MLFYGLTSVKFAGLTGGTGVSGSMGTTGMLFTLQLADTLSLYVPRIACFLAHSLACVVPSIMMDVVIST